MIVKPIRGILWSEMPSQVVYQTNADLIASHEAIVKNSLMAIDQTEKCLLWFRFVDSQTVFLLSAKGKLQVKWNNVNEKITLFKLIKKLLVANHNEELVIKPLKQQMWIEYPVPESFKLYWCDETTEFVLKKPVENRDRPPESSGIIKTTSAIDQEVPKMDLKKEIEIVREALQQLRRDLRFFREPTMNEFTVKLGRDREAEVPTVILHMAGWKPQSPREAEKTAEDAINLAGWLSWKGKGEQNTKLEALCKEAINRASVSTIERAQYILKNYPYLAAKVRLLGLEWPNETKDRWLVIFHRKPPVPQYWQG